ncbi:MAG TPA: hypothetical protein VN937_09965 [Blastocatellia bacterium]|nr:hypothetical protein [Blastocatellia bacterium]
MSSQSETERLEITGLPLGTTDALTQLAADYGQTAEEYARMILEAKILAQKPFKEILAPVRKSFQDSGMTDDELAALVDKAREDFDREGVAEDE